MRDWDRENFGTCLETATTCDDIKEKKISDKDQRSRRGGVVDDRHSDDSRAAWKVG